MFADFDTLWSNLSPREQAVAFLTEAVEVLQHQLGSDHPTCAFALERMGTLFKARAECERAMEFCERSEAILKAAPHADAIALATVHGRLACCDGREAASAESFAALEHALENLRHGLPPTDDRLAELQRCLDGLATGR